MSTTTPLTTTLLSGRYRIGKVIGRGGMSTVYRATDTVLDRAVAVKVLLAALADGDPSYIARFQREARTAASLRHPAVVKIYDTGTDDETHYIVMEYVAGRGLEEVIRERRVGYLEAARIGSQVAEAVAAAHAAGILHRDIKPANVILRPDGGVKVLDFGVARTVQETTITNPAFAVGTVSYMAPERVLGRSGDERTDIYGIGCLLYALLTGRPPFVGDESVAILHQQMHAEPLAPSEAGAVMSPGPERLVLRMLAKDPADRPQSATEVASLLAVAAGSEATSVAPAGPQRPASARGDTAVMPVSRPRRGVDDRLSRDGRDPRRRLTLLALAGATIIVIALAVFAGGGAKRAAGSGRTQATGRGLGTALGRSGVSVARRRTATLQTSTAPQALTAPPPAAGARANPPSGPATAPPPPGHAKKVKPPKPAKPGHTPPGHGGVPPGQIGKAPKGGHGKGD
jgi:serine/threonine-protein kinase